jgi:phosphatidylglycerophosphatase A
LLDASFDSESNPGNRLLSQKSTDWVVICNLIELAEPSSNWNPSGLTDRLGHLVATGIGAGFSPIAPGTVGSLEGVVVFLSVVVLARKFLNIDQPSLVVLLFAFNILLFIVGVWSASRTCEITGLKDPGRIVIDEVSGQSIALMPLAGASSLVGIIVGFLLFRLFDIFKPYPIRKLEDLPSGLGVMADDALAGIYSAVLLWLAHYWRLI